MICVNVTISVLFRSRLVWLLCVLASGGLFTYQVATRMMTFFDYNTSVDVQLFYTDKVAFPAVTVCNQNAFRWMTKSDIFVFLLYNHDFNILACLVLCHVLSCVP